MTDARKQVMDDVLDPALKQIADICKQHRIHFSALVQYSDDTYAQTTSMGSDACLSLRLARIAGETNGNPDDFLARMLLLEGPEVESSMLLNILRQAIVVVTEDAP